MRLDFQRIGDSLVPDRISPERRSEVMSRIRKYDSRPERLVREQLERAGIAFETYPRMPGSPDIVIPTAQVAVFVNGCYWHGCPKHYRPAKSRIDYWHPKILGNKARDRSNARILRKLGWSVVSLWECAVTNDPSKATARVARRVLKRTGVR